MQHGFALCASQSAVRLPALAKRPHQTIHAQAARPNVILSCPPCSLARAQSSSPPFASSPNKEKAIHRRSASSSTAPPNTYRRPFSTVDSWLYLAQRQKSSFGGRWGQHAAHPHTKENRPPDFIFFYDIPPLTTREKLGLAPGRKPFPNINKCAITTSQAVTHLVRGAPFAQAALKRLFLSKLQN